MDLLLYNSFIVILDVRKHSLEQTQHVRVLCEHLVNEVKIVE